MPIIESLAEIAAKIPEANRVTKIERDPHCDNIHEVQGAITGIEKPIHTKRNSYGTLEALR